MKGQGLDCRATLGNHTRQWGGPTVGSLSLTAVVLVVIVFCWRVVSVQHTVPAARVFHDTRFYFDVARNDLWSLGLWAGGRSPLPALLFKLCNFEAERIRAWLLAISVVSWSTFAVALSRLTKSPYLKPVAAALALSLGASRTVAQWNHAILSESLSFSLAAVCLASALMFMVRPKVWLLPTILSALALALCRDSNAYLVLMLGALAAILASFRAAQRRSWWPAAGLALGFTSTFLVVNASADAGMRWEYPLTNVIVSRVLPDPVKLAAFRAEGMPNLARLRPRRPRRAYGTDRSLAPFRSWLSEHGKQAYERFLISSPGYLLAEPNVADLLGSDVERYVPRGMQDNMPPLLERLWSRDAWLVHLIIVVSLSVACVAMPAARRNYLAMIGICLAVLVLPHGLLIWHGDAMETARHGLQAVFQLRVALILLLLALADILLARRFRFWKWQAERLKAQPSHGS